MKDKLREDRRDAIAKAIADAIGHGMREKCERHADAVLAVLDAEGDGGAVGEVVEQDVTTCANARGIRHLYPVRTKDDLLKPGTKLYTHPAQPAARGERIACEASK